MICIGNKYIFFIISLDLCKNVFFKYKKDKKQKYFVNIARNNKINKDTKHF